MRTQCRLLAGMLTIAAALVAVPASAQQGGAAPAAPSLSAALANDVGALSNKFTGLAKVMAGKYDWRPAPGVRSAGEVFNLIVTENRMLAGVLTGASQSASGGGQGGRGNQIADPAQLEEALRSSYAAVKDAVTKLSAADLNTSVKMFGSEMTKQSAALMLLFDQHEHLGQSIAYARSNGVVPPWSK